MVCPAWGQDEEALALQGVRREIQALESRVALQQKERDEGYRRLRAVELEIADASSELNELQARNEIVLERRVVLAREARAARARLDGERDKLAQQVRVTYLTGRQERLKLLFGQENPSRLGRMLVYYDYLNKARSMRVEAVTADINILARLVGETDEAALTVAKLERAQASELDSLGRARDERELMLIGLDEEIKRAGSQIDWLQDEAQRLTELIAKVQGNLDVLPDNTGAAFPNVKGALSWPVPGAFLRDYGQPRAGGQLKWNGVLLGAPPGTPVSSVHHGRVVYADWLPGLGLLVIVDHGEGYMSLYGHNETIVTELGAWVTSGEAIARVGDSGGQAQSALYFEIRHGGEPVDPRPWIGQAQGTP